MLIKILYRCVVPLFSDVLAFMLYKKAGLKVSHFLRDLQHIMLV